MGVGTVFIGMIVTALVLSPLANAHSDSRADIFYLKEDIAKSREAITSYEKLIESQKAKIPDLEKKVDELKEKERIAREWDSFNDTPETRDELAKARLNLTNAENELKTTNDYFIELLNKKNAELAKIGEIDSNILSKEKQLKTESAQSLVGLERIIGVDTSKTCKTIIKNGFDSTCPSIEDLIQLDTSNPLSGKFGMYDGVFQRGKPLVKNDHELYRFDADFGIILNPSSNVANRIKMIIIEPSLTTYLNPIDMVKMNNTRTVNHDRYVHNCENAVITADNWKFLLPDTIHYLRTGCTVTQFNSVETINDPVTEIDISTSRHWQDARKLESDMIKCKELCFEY